MASRIPQELKGNSGNQRNHGNTNQNPHSEAVYADKEEQNHTDHKDQHDKATAAPLVEARAPHHVIYCQRLSAFNAVDAFVLRAVIAIQPPDVLHRGNSDHINQENGQPDHALQNCHHGITPNPTAHQLHQKYRKHCENSHR